MDPRSLPLVVGDDRGERGSPYAVQAFAACSDPGRADGPPHDQHRAAAQVFREETRDFTGRHQQLRPPENFGDLGPGWVVYPPSIDDFNGRDRQRIVPDRPGWSWSPCSMSTLASRSPTGSPTNLITRAADVHLKERRKLILVPRETPLSLVHLENMTAVTRAGAIVLPAMPGWYHKPRSLNDLVDFVVARICDQLGVDVDLMDRWGGEDRPTEPGPHFEE